MQSLEKFMKKHFGVVRLFDMQEAIDICHAQIVHEWKTRPKE
jgi:hypothetical protein